MKKIYLLIGSVLISAIQLVAQEASKTTATYDFVPGAKTIFLDDFSKEPVGAIPAQWITNSSGEIVTSGKYPGRWFQMNKSGYFVPKVNGQFTDNFTVEFDLAPISTTNKANLSGLSFQIIAGSLTNPIEEKSTPGMAGIGIACENNEFNWTNWSETDEGHKDKGSVAFTFNSGEKYHVSFWIQNQSVRVYINEKKILALQEGLIEGYNYNIFRIQTAEDIKPLISNFNIATGLKDKGK